VIAEVPAAVWAGAIALLAGIATATINGRFQLRTVATQKTSSDTSTVIAGFEKLTQALERTVADLRGEVRAATERAERAEAAAADANRRLDIQAAEHAREIARLNDELQQLRHA
jgi:hypothetical protein